MAMKASVQFKHIILIGIQVNTQSVVFDSKYELISFFRGCYFDDRRLIERTVFYTVADQIIQDAVDHRPYGIDYFTLAEVVSKGNVMGINLLFQDIMDRFKFLFQRYLLTNLKDVLTN